MGYLIGQMILTLIIAGFLGFVFGWFLKAALKRDELSRLEKTYKINLASRDMEIAELRSDLEQVQKKK